MPMLRLAVADNVPALLLPPVKVGPVTETTVLPLVIVLALPMPMPMFIPRMSTIEPVIVPPTIVMPAAAAMVPELVMPPENVVTLAAPQPVVPASKMPVAPAPAVIVLLFVVASEKVPVTMVMPVLAGEMLPVAVIVPELVTPPPKLGRVMERQIGA